MKNILLTMLIIFDMAAHCNGQAALVDVENKKYKTTEKIKVEGQVGYMVVPENRNNTSSREIKLKYIHLKSIADNPSTPLIYLEGGGDGSTWQAEDPEELTFWLEVLEVSDLIFLDQRGAGDNSLAYIWEGDFPTAFFISEEQSNEHYRRMTTAGLAHFENKGIDVTGYNLEENARDVNALATALGINTYSIFGFSFGSQIGMTTMKLFPERIERAILAGSDAPNQAFNYPRYFDQQIDKIANIVSQDTMLSAKIPDFRALVERVMLQLEETPATVSIKNPLTGDDMDLDIGSFGLAIILRLDIDDNDDLPAIPRLLYTIDQGDYEKLTWFAQKRIVYGLALPGNGINQQVASGATQARWAEIKMEAEQSMFGNVVNFPFTGAKDHWPENKLKVNTLEPMKTDIPTLFITGTLDHRTPVEQVEETMKGFSNATHIKVENAGHAQAIWDANVNNIFIPAFLSGEKVESQNEYFSDITFLPLEGPTKGHPSVTGR
ncbi:MAG: alpha/beta hydrolase [Cyclobacteriaceae bacterium]